MLTWSPKRLAIALLRGRTDPGRPSEPYMTYDDYEQMRSMYADVEDLCRGVEVNRAGFAGGSNF